jgi:hypothetical protein
LTVAICEYMEGADLDRATMKDVRAHLRHRFGEQTADMRSKVV